MEYAILSLHLRLTQHNTFRITAEGPNGEWAESEDDNPFTDDMLNNLTKFMQERVADADDTQQLSNYLSDILFPPSVRKLYYAVQQRVIEHSQKGLQLRLCLSREAKGEIDLGNYPWEIAAIDGGMLIKNPRIAFVRTLDLDQPFAPVVTRNPVDRILLVGSTFPDPDGTIDLPLAVEAEIAQIREALAPRIADNKLEVDSLIDPTPEQLDEQLASDRYDIVHYAGIIKEMKLTLSDNNGERLAVDANSFVELVTSNKVRMVTLNASKSQALAEVLLTKGIDTVIAQNYKIADAAAVQFAQHFYLSLSDNNSIEQAIFTARRASAKNKEENVWTSTIVNTRALSGQFWASESNLVVQTVIKDGRLVSEMVHLDQANASAVNYNLQNAIDNQAKVLDQTQQTRIGQLINQARGQIESGQIKDANRIITEAQNSILQLLQEQDQAKLDAIKLQNRIATGVMAFVFAIVGVLVVSFASAWTPATSIPVLGIPISVIVWSLLGGAAAMLNTMLSIFRPNEGGEIQAIRMEWIILRPVVALFMGSVIYLVLNSGLVALGQEGLSNAGANQTTYIIWTLAFLGGFSDQFTSLIFNKIEQSVVKEDETGGAGEPAGPVG